MSQTLQKVRSIIAGQLTVKPEIVTPDARLVEDLGADSLDVVELIMALEEGFSITIQDDDAEQMLTVNDVVRYLEEVPAEPA